MQGTTLVSFLALLVLLGTAHAGKYQAAPSSTPAPPAAAAPTAGPPKPSPISGAAAEALRRGRALANKEEYYEATKALETALALAPNDAAVLSELGWAEYQQHVLEEAEKHTRAAIALSTTPALKAASLYNLGLILQAGRGTEGPDTEGALNAYRDSLRERPSSAAKWAMALLDLEASKDKHAAIAAYMESGRAQSNSAAQKGLERLDPVLAQIVSMSRSGVPLFPEITSSANARVRLCPLEHFMQGLNPLTRNRDHSGAELGLCSFESLKGLRLAGTPFLAAQLWIGRSNRLWRTHQLALRTRRGWSVFWLPDSYSHGNGNDVSIAVTGPTATPNGPVLKVRVTDTITERDGPDRSTQDTFFIGIGRSGAPIVIRK